MELGATDRAANANRVGGAEERDRSDHLGSSSKVETCTKFVNVIQGIKLHWKCALVSNWQDVAENG